MERGSFIQEFIAGNFGGIVGITAVYPLDTLKIRQQMNPNDGTMLDIFKKMKKTDGIKSLYRGILSPVAGFGFTFAVSFSTYGASCRTLAEYHQVTVDKISLMDMTIAGAITGLVQSPFRQIMERVKSVMQVREGNSHKSPYSWSGACLMDLIRKEGLKNGLFRGMTSVIYREVPQFSVYYPSYHLFKIFYMEKFPDNVALASFLSGGSAGVVQWLPPILCIDAVKSHMQTCPPGTYSSVSDCISKMYSQHGIKVFFRGFTAAMFRAFPLHGIVFLGYEFALRCMNQPFHEVIVPSE